MKTTFHEDGVAEIVVDRPPVNALDVEGWFELARQVTAAGERARVVLLRAEGRGFNAGVDIKEMQRTEGFEALITRVRYDPHEQMFHVERLLRNVEPSFFQCVDLDTCHGAIQRAIELRPNSRVLLAQAYVTRSWDLAVVGLTREAIADASAAIGLQPDDPVVLATAHLHRSFALSDLGRIDEARADASTARSALPDDHELMVTVDDWMVHLQNAGGRAVSVPATLGS